ncbi:SAM-dependent methyltransferase [Streptomyces lavendulocolor]|uniref:SAM-dependent methyltransferase n=1 Tax=Streptomyces lavendulocolor TaxID=67316 RepID=UPI0033F039BD
MGKAQLFFDRIHRGLFDIPSLLPPEQQERVLQRCFEHKHRRPDPWRHAVDSYEAYKYAMTLNCIPARPYRSIVDIGCSEGVFTCKVAHAYPDARTVGIDISGQAIERARHRAEENEQDITFEVLNIVRQTPKTAFDLAICSELLYYLGIGERLHMASTHIAWLLTPKGLLVLVHPWPESRRLNRHFDTNPSVVRHAEHIYSDSHRPFAITLYEHL